MDTTKARITRHDDPARPWMLFIPPRGLVDYEGGDPDGAQLDTYGTTYWETHQAAADVLDEVCRAKQALPPPQVVVRPHGDTSWTVEICFGGQPVVGMIYDQELDPLIGELLGRDESTDPKLAVWDASGDVTTGDELAMPRVRADWPAIHRAHLEGVFWEDGPLSPPPELKAADPKPSIDGWGRSILTLGQFRALTEHLDDDVHVCVDDLDGWYSNIGSVAVPVTDEDGGIVDGVSAVTLFPGVPFDTRQV